MTDLSPGVVALALACLVVIAGCATGRDAVDSRHAAVTNASLGADYLRKNANAKAQSRFRRALGYDSDNVDANWGMAIVSQRLDKPRRARRYYEKTLDLRPSGDILNGYAAFLCQHDDYARAMKYFQRAAADPGFAGVPNALANAGLCAYRHDRAAIAERFYRKALAADPDQATALVNLARLHYDKADYLHARAFIERADAATGLDAKQALLGARIEMVLGDRGAAGGYLKRYNAAHPRAALTLSQLEQARR